jgi:hypothetical protein
MDSSEDSTPKETVTGDSDLPNSVLWNKEDEEGDNNATFSLSDDTPDSMALPTTKIVGVDGSVNIIEHPAARLAAAQHPHNTRAAIMLDVPTEMHPLNYERNATIPEHTWKRRLTDTYKPLKEFKVRKHIIQPPPHTTL